MFETLTQNVLQCTLWMIIAYFVGSCPPASKWIRFLLWDKLFPPKC